MKEKNTNGKDMDGSEGRKLRLSRSLSRFETQDIKTQLLFNHYFIKDKDTEG